MGERTEAGTADGGAVPGNLEFLERIIDSCGIAARNAWALTFGSGIDDRDPAPTTVLWDEPHRQLRRFQRPPTAPNAQVATLLVPPLAAPASCFDLRADQSVARFLLGTGRAPYVIDYGDIAFADRRMGFEDWIDDILPEAILRSSADLGGAPVDLVGWSLGGTLSLLTAAAHPELPSRAIAAVGAPLDYTEMPGVAQLRAAAALTGGLGMSTLVRATGGVPATFTRLAYRATAWHRELGRPWFIASNLAATDRLARMTTIDRFMADMPGYPGRFYGQLWGKLLLGNELGRGTVRLGDRDIALSQVSAPVLLVGGPDDAITPAAAVAAGTRTLSGAASVRYETAAGSHLGILTGPEADRTTWRYLDEFLASPAAAVLG